MKELKCKNCGSSSLRKENGIWICDHCGSRFIEENKDAKKIDSYVMKAEKAFGNGKYDKMDDYAIRILEIDPEHSYAWLMRMYYFGLQKETCYTNDLIEAGVNAVRFEKEDLEDTEYRVYKAFIEWGESGAFNAWSFICTFQRGDLEREEWKHPERIESLKVKEIYWNWPLKAERQIDSAICALAAVPKEYFLPAEVSEEDDPFYRNYLKKQYNKALDKCEDALERMRTAYEAARFDDRCMLTNRKCESRMNELWEKIGLERPLRSTIRIRMLDEDMKYREKKNG